METKRQLELEMCRWIGDLLLTVVSLGDSCMLTVVALHVFIFRCHQTNLINDEFGISIGIFLSRHLLGSGSFPTLATKFCVLYPSINFSFILLPRGTP